MNDRVDVDAILDRFREWLESARAEDAHQVASSLGVSGESEATREFGIIDLIEEFTALRHEVNLQTRSSRGLLEQTESVKRALEQAIEQFRSVEPKEAQAAWTSGKALALGLADLDEALERGGREIERARRQIADLSAQSLQADLQELHRSQSWLRRRLSGHYHKQVIEVVKRDAQSRHGLFDAFSEGFGLIQKRLLRVMAAEGVVPIPCEGCAVDPELMTVLEVVDAAGLAPGTVTKELRRGYTWRGRVLRYAEVQAVRTGLTLPEAGDQPPANGSETTGTIPGAFTSTSTQPSG
jgi:molecular chaperone GrpE